MFKFNISKSKTVEKVSSNQNPWLFALHGGLDIIASYMEMTVNHPHQDPYEPTSIMEIQLMVNCWFGAFSGLGFESGLRAPRIPFSRIHFRGFNRNPNH